MCRPSSMGEASCPLTQAYADAAQLVEFPFKALPRGAMSLPIVTSGSQRSRTYFRALSIAATTSTSCSLNPRIPTARTRSGRSANSRTVLRTMVECRIRTTKLSELGPFLPSNQLRTALSFACVSRATVLTDDGVAPNSARNAAAMTWASDSGVIAGKVFPDSD